MSTTPDNRSGPSAAGAAPALLQRSGWLRDYAFIDFATQGYIVLVGLIIVVFHNARLPSWPWVALAHVAGWVAVHLLITLHARYPRNPALAFLRQFYPILLYTGFYHETGFLCQMITTGYLDPHLLRLERCLFGFQPGLDLMGLWPWRIVSEVLYAAYFSYYLMIVGVGLALLRRDRGQFAHYISVVSFVFYACYLVYIFTPVVGPRILCTGIVDAVLPSDVVPVAPVTTPPAVAGSFFFQLMAWIYVRFETPGAAFPSSHVAVAIVTLYFSFLYLRPIRWAHLAMVILLCVGTVYGRYHYVVDVVAGALTAALLVPLANRLLGWKRGGFP